MKAFILRTSICNKNCLQKMLRRVAKEILYPRGAVDKTAGKEQWQIWGERPESYVTHSSQYAFLTVQICPSLFPMTDLSQLSGKCPVSWPGRASPSQTGCNAFIIPSTLRLLFSRMKWGSKRTFYFALPYYCFPLFNLYISDLPLT